MQGQSSQYAQYILIKDGDDSVLKIYQKDQNQKLIQLYEFSKYNNRLRNRVIIYAESVYDS